MDGLPKVGDFARHRLWSKFYEVAHIDYRNNDIYFFSSGGRVYHNNRYDFMQTPNPWIIKEKVVSYSSYLDAITA